MKDRVHLFETYLDELYPNPICELQYSKDYELLFAVVMSAQTTDKRVNSVTSSLFSQYPSLESFAGADMEDIAGIIKPIGTFHKKAEFLVGIAKRFVEQGYHSVPQDRSFLESLPGVGHKTANVVLSVLFQVPAVAVDTHVDRVSKRLGFAKDKALVLDVEKKLMKVFSKRVWSKRHHQMVFFGRYHCKAVKPECDDCKMESVCPYRKKKR